MEFIKQIEKYNPVNEQEKKDKEIILDFISKNDNVLVILDNGTDTLKFKIKKTLRELTTDRYKFEIEEWTIVIDITSYESQNLTDKELLMMAFDATFTIEKE